MAYQFHAGILLATVLCLIHCFLRQRRLRQQRLLEIWRLRRGIEDQRQMFRLQRLRRRRVLTFQAAFLASVNLKRSSLSSRQVWAKERSTSFLETTVRFWSEEEFKGNFRVSRATFAYLCSELTPRLQKSHFIRRPLSVEQRVAIALWRLGTNIEYRSIGHLFGVGLATVFCVVREFCEAVVEILLPHYINIPTGVHLQEIVDGFNSKWGFPQCVGAIDGTHIPIIAPKQNALDYYNRKGHHSVVMQAMVSSNYTFMDVYVGWPGSVHDARVLTNSKLFREAEAGTLLPEIKKSIRGIDVPLLILGDPAYPLLPWLMKPYTDNGRLNAKQWRFNYQLSRARMVVECAFGRLKGRWRSLLKRNDTSIQFLPNYVAACCVLHNICEIHGDDFNNDWMFTQEDESYNQTGHTSVPHGSTTAIASRIREALTDHFSA